MKFELKHRNDLSINDFKDHSVWAEYYSSDEVEHIVNEGYTKEDVERKLEEIEWEGDFWFRTNHLKNTKPYMFTRFKAEFELPNKTILKGYIEYCEYSGVQNYSLFVNGEFIGLNAQHPEITDEEELMLKTKLNLSELYPVRIKSTDKELNIEKYRPIK